MFEWLFRRNYDEEDVAEIAEHFSNLSSAAWEAVETFAGRNDFKESAADSYLRAKDHFDRLDISKTLRSSLLEKIYLPEGLEQTLKETDNGVRERLGLKLRK